MAVFPTLSKGPTQKYTETYMKPSVRTPFDGNYEQTRPKFTRAVNTFTVNFKFIDATDKSTLKTFFAANNGESFDWTNPLDSVTYLVRFADDQLDFKNLGADRFEITLKLQEV
jgi:phage-related protein